MLRDYEAIRAYEQIKDKSAFNVPNYVKRHKYNQHLTRYCFKDGSMLFIYSTRSRADTCHPDWKGTKDDIHLGPQKGLPLKINKQGR